MKILKTRDLKLNFGDNSSGRPSYYAYDKEHKHYHVKRSTLFHLTPLREHGDPKNWREEKHDPAYGNISAVWEVCFYNIAKAMLQDKVPNAYLYRRKNQLFVASERRMDFFALREEIVFDGNIVRYVNRNDPASFGGFAFNGPPPKITGIIEILIITGFLGDKDYFNESNIGAFVIGGEWRTRRIDFDCAGVFNEAWDFSSFIDNLNPQKFKRNLGYLMPRLSSALDNSDYEKECDLILKKLADFDLGLLKQVWDEYKPLLLEETAKLTDPVIRIRTLDYIIKDSPIAVLRERQEQVKDYLAQDKSTNSNLGYTAFLESERKAFEKWQKRVGGSKNGSTLSSMGTSIEQAFSRVS